MLGRNVYSRRRELYHYLRCSHPALRSQRRREDHAAEDHQDRKSTRLNSSHQIISYAVFCLKKKKQVSNAGSDVARFLSFNAWPKRDPFREGLAGLPAE